MKMHEAFVLIVVNAVRERYVSEKAFYTEELGTNHPIPISKMSVDTEVAVLGNPPRHISVEDLYITEIFPSLGEVSFEMGVPISKFLHRYRSPHLVNKMI